MGARFLQDGLVVPGRYTVFSNNKEMVTIGHFRVPKSFTFKTSFTFKFHFQVRNLCCGNEFYLHHN